MQRCSFILFLCPFLLCICFPASSSAQIFFDDFNGTSIDTTVWTLLNSKWGENPAKGRHGGVVPENVSAGNGNLIIRANGNLYKGSIKGHGQNTKVGGVASTKKMYASGSFEIKAKICPHPGALTAFWTFYYENDNFNHEIDFEFPGHNQAPRTPDSSRLDWGLMTNWRGVGEDQYNNADKFFGNQTDGQYHLYRFEWHTGSDVQKPRVEWYYDNKLLHTSFENIPAHAGCYNIGIWFPWWIKEADFESAYLYVDWVKITPFNEPNDLK
ncbi:glycosyl hydrolase family 16 [Arcticibacter tournemirensis]|uniref:Glycoside hydrolase family 16 protein n=1 Tax=Arcticibacter tournemirensis TaxID=699437 RepID=A0A5M9HDC9_9SPHI|nr:glycoside hydrolase family 16 protein [Arcticibacter tournemirensis]KAA8484952.1 glycoside hydrolase family 16 protein [Arcticibacter tournemirensis]TQM50607.1 glycosyl hydrolase family 16 [Arcticibacter tournemirensis]